MGLPADLITLTRVTIPARFWDDHYLGGPGDYVKVNVTELDTDELRELAVSLRQTATDLKVLIVERRAAV